MSRCLGVRSGVIVCTAHARARGVVGVVIKSGGVCYQIHVLCVFDMYCTRICTYSRRNTCIAQIRLRYTLDTFSIHSRYMYSSLVYCAQSDTCNTKRIQCRYMYYDVLRNVTAYMSGDQRCARWMGARECFPSTSGTLAAAGDSLLPGQSPSPWPASSAALRCGRHRFIGGACALQRWLGPSTTSPSLLCRSRIWILGTPLTRSCS